MTKDTRANLVFAGTPEFAATHLAALLENDCRLAAVYTQPDRPAGRGRRLQPSPVKMLAEARGIEVIQPETLKDEAAQAQLAALQPDLMIVVAYGQILPQAVLDIPRYGCINVHASLLPRWRGAAPIQRAIEAGDQQTGVTIMQMEAGLDTGPMLAESRCPINQDTNAGTLHDTLAVLGAELLVETVARIPDILRDARVQPEAGITYASKITKQEARIDWRQPAEVLDRRIRAFNPFPVCYTEFNDQRLKVHQARVAADRHATSQTPGTIIAVSSSGLLEVACGEGSSICLELIQLAGGKAMATSELLRSRAQAFEIGTVFGSDTNSMSDDRP